METGCAQNDTVGIFRENSAVTSCTVRINAWAGYIIIRVPRHIIPILVCTGLRLANAAYPALQTALDLLGRKDIYVGTVEGWPGLEDVLRQLEPGGPWRIGLLPLMLVAGDHARNDMAGDWKSRMEKAGHTVTCTFTGLGQLAWVQKMYQEKLAALL